MPYQNSTFDFADLKTAPQQAMGKELELFLTIMSENSSAGMEKEG